MKTYAFALLTILSLLGGAMTAQAHEGQWDSRHHYQRDNYGYWNDHHRYQHYVLYRNHHGYWDNQSGVRVFINVD